MYFCKKVNYYKLGGNGDKMREEFYETSVAPSNEGSQKVWLKIYSVLFVLTVISFCILSYLWLLTFDTGFIILLAIALISGVIFFLLKRKLCAYYDYTYISGEVRIIKVINGKTRRKFLVFDCKAIKQLGKVGSESFNKIYDSKDYKLKVATPNGVKSEKQLYYVYLTHEGQNNLLILECEEKFLQYIVANRGKTVIEKDYK